ncbi:MAG TPA: TetR/AcrR family transcriptional regulator [Solirubrobacterales bacterium]|nr:TetR/AcrR family transcriptional regulator [Solirubrobacterales bacterium]
MVRTPWGDASQLREKMLPPGRGTPRSEVRENQRRRLFAALVAAVSERGYEATRVEDLIELSGVSRKAFYELFENKEDCLLVAVQELIEPTIAAIARSNGRPADLAQAREVFDAFLRLIVEQSAAARMCFVEIYGAGAGAAGTLERTGGAFEAFASEQLALLPGRDGMPPQMIRALIGGLHKVIHKRLYRREEEELLELAPQLWEWGLSYLPPPQPLQRPQRRSRRPGRPHDGYDETERLLRTLAAVVAEKGYPATTVGDIAKRASISLSTFYEHFEGKQEAMLAALDSGSAQMLAAVLPAFRRAPGWPQAVRGAFEAMFAFGAAEPAYTRLGAVEVYPAGKQALAHRDQVMEGLEALLTPGYEVAKGAPAIAAEAVGGAVYALVYDQVKARGAANLPEIAPLATYIALCPFLGAEEACAVANREEGELSAPHISS